MHPETLYELGLLAGFLWLVILWAARPSTRAPREPRQVPPGFPSERVLVSRAELEAGRALCRRADAALAELEALRGERGRAARG